MDMSSLYIYHLFHNRSHVEFELFQLISKKDTKENHAINRAKRSNRDLFSSLDMCNFNLYFYRYCMNHIEETECSPLPFIKTSKSNFVLFGYFKNKYFYKTLDCYKKYYSKENYYLFQIGRELSINFEFVIQSFLRKLVLEIELEKLGQCEAMLR
jgi:hypothetical protein